jgi:hypothetical protein
MLLASLLLLLLSLMLVVSMLLLASLHAVPRFTTFANIPAVVGIPAVLAVLLSFLILLWPAFLLLWWSCYYCHPSCWLLLASLLLASLLLPAFLQLLAGFAAIADSPLVPEVLTVASLPPIGYVFDLLGQNEASQERNG